MKAQIRAGGAWVDSTRAGSVRVASAWQAFAPAAPAANRFLAWPAPPTVMAGNDSNQDYNLGIRFSVDAAAPCNGIRWAYVPTQILSAPNGGTHYAAVWSVIGETRLRNVAFVPVAGATDQDYLFASPVNLDAGALYVASIFTRNYVFRDSGGIEVGSSDGFIQADQGKLAASGDPLSFPASNFAAHYYISPLIGAAL